MNSTQSPRYDFQPIIHRRPVKFPGGRRLALLIYVNVEHAPFGSTEPTHAIYPGTMHLSPDILNHGWRDYGMRVGIWRIMRLMDRLGLRVTANLYSDVCREYPVVIEEGNARGWQWSVIGDNTNHFLTNMKEDEERAFINRQIEIIAAATGTRPRGWLGNFLAESFSSPDLLAEAGIEFVSDYTHDELPTPMRTKTGSLITMPYSLELNDVPTILGKGASGEVFGQMIRDQFDVLYEEASELPRVMAISIHPFVTGHPFRMKHFAQALGYIVAHSDVWSASAGEINDWFRAEFMSSTSPA